MDFLSPEKNKQKLSDAGLFMLVYEILNSNITEKTRDYFLGVNLVDQYKHEVLVKAKHIYEASLRWLIQMEAIEESDFQSLMEIRDYRNSVAHNIPEYIFNETEGVETSIILRAAKYAKKIDNFWTNIAVDINPEFDHQEVDREKVNSVLAEVLETIVSMHLALH